MSASSLAPDREEAMEELLGRLPKAPAEGWLSVLAVVTMVVVYATSLLDAGWIPAREGDAGYLPWLALLGLGFGAGGAKLGWGRWRTHFVGAAFAGLLVPLAAGAAMLVGAEVGVGPEDLALRMATASEEVRLVWRDLAIEGRPVTYQYGHIHLVFGAMVWAAGQAAGFTIFGHRRPLDAVVVLGLLLVANMILAASDQLLLLILFSAAALVLLIRTHVFEEEVAWARRRIGEPKSVGLLYLKGGAAFVTVAIAGSLLLTATASSAPLQDLWRDLPSRFVGLSEWLQRIAPPDGPFRPPGAISFGPTTTATGVWRPSDAVAFRAQFSPTEIRRSKWLVRTYSEYLLYNWTEGEGRATIVPAGAPILSGAADEPSLTGRRELRVRISPDGYRQAVVSPQSIASVSLATTARTLGDEGWFMVVEPSDGGAAYDLVAYVPLFQDVPGGITEARLRAAGTDYPDEIDELYVPLPPEALGPEATALLATIRAGIEVPDGVDPDNAYDLARAIERYLSSDANFTYDDNIADEQAAQCDGISSAECFARIKRGFCTQYAATMAVLLRSAGVPARIAAGFLPGDRDASGLEIVTGSTQHEWVEVYFPGTGWVEFDPTGGSRGQPQPIPSGSLGPSGPPATTPPPTAAPQPTTPGGGPVGPTGPGTDVAPFIAITLILLVGLGALAVAAVRRAPRQVAMHPDRAWGALGRWAARLGLGPRPSQTVYEYAGALGDEIPAARVELTTLARAKVEVAYGRREVDPDRLRRIGEAYQRLRLALISFAVRRGLRRRRGRGRSR